MITFRKIGLLLTALAIFMLAGCASNPYTYRQRPSGCNPRAPSAMHQVTGIFTNGKFLSDTIIGGLAGAVSGLGSGHVGRNAGYGAAAGMVKGAYDAQRQMERERGTTRTSARTQRKIDPVTGRVIARGPITETCQNSRRVQGY